MRSVERVLRMLVHDEQVSDCRIELFLQEEQQ